MRCKYCGNKISIIDSILDLELICYYCREAKIFTQIDKELKIEREQREKWKKEVSERIKHFKRDE